MPDAQLARSAQPHIAATLDSCQFRRYQIESQIAAIHNRVDQLSLRRLLSCSTRPRPWSPSTSTRDVPPRNAISDNLRCTNLEAELSRAVAPARPLPALIVIDFIDMEEHRNNAAWNAKITTPCARPGAHPDRTISSFGSAGCRANGCIPAPRKSALSFACIGRHRPIRSVDLTALHVLRMVEEEITKSFSPGVTVSCRRRLRSTS